LKLDGQCALYRPSRLYAARGNPDWDYLHAVRALWDGPLVMKGVMQPKMPRACATRVQMRSGCRTMAGGNSMARPLRWLPGAIRAAWGRYAADL
jgi:hypothetical protein